MGVRVSGNLSAETQLRAHDGSDQEAHRRIYRGVEQLRVDYLLRPAILVPMSEYRCMSQPEHRDRVCWEMTWHYDQHPDLWERLSDDERLVELEDLSERSAAGASWPFNVPKFEVDEERMD